MAFILTKKVCISYRFPTRAGSPLRLTVLPPLLGLSTKTQHPKDAPFVAQYLISFFGFPPDRALKVAASPNLSGIRTSDRPDGVVHFLRDIGLSDSQIKKLVTWNPQFLSRNVAKTLRPRVHQLMAEGFTGDILIRLILSHPNVAVSKLIIPRIQFWRNFLNNREADLLKVLMRNPRILSFDTDKYMIPNIQILKDYGFSDQQILKVLTSANSFILRKPDSTKKLLEKTETLGFSRGSSMFVPALAVVGTFKFETIMRKLEFLQQNYGWSEKEAYDAFRKFPTLVHLSEQNLKSKMDFLLGKAGLKNQDIFSKPFFLGFSLEQRVIPRYHVLSVLKIKGLSSCTLHSVLRLSEKDFLNKFVVFYKKEAPELEEVYSAACQVKMHV